jgi:GntR family transcriptional repressor for pyruvate dehydrogenase complex
MLEHQSAYRRIMALASIKPIARKRLFESVVEQLYDLILDGQLSPGDCLPSERELCAMFQVSRTSIRSAIQVLEALGLVQSFNGKATRIKKAHPEEVGGVLSTVLFHDLGDMKQLYECRRFLESWVAFYAATRLTEEQIDQLDQLAIERKRLIECGENGTSRTSPSTGTWPSMPEMKCQSGWCTPC